MPWVLCCLGYGEPIENLFRFIERSWNGGQWFANGRSRCGNKWGNFWDGVRNGAISSGLKHAAPAIDDKIKKAERLARQYKLNGDRIVAESIVMEVLLETTKVGDILKAAREKYVETYGSKSVKQISEDFSAVMDVLIGHLISGLGSAIS